jgi:hypothetical protein
MNVGRATSRESAPFRPIRENMKTIFVAGLYSRNKKGEKADVFEVLENIRNGQQICRLLIDMGYAPYCPRLDYQYFISSDHPPNEEQIKAVSLAWLEKSDVILVISGRGLGGGVDAEIARAKELGIREWDLERGVRLGSAL